MRYLRKFNTLDEYNTALPGLETPQTSLIAEDYSVKFTPWYDTRLDEYFTIESLEDNNEIIYNEVFNVENNNYNLYYSLDGGTTWSYTVKNSSPFITLNYGEKILLKHEGNYSAAQGNGYFIRPSKLHNVRGNILSMVWGDNFKGKTTFKSTNYNGGLNYFFKNNTKLVSAKDLMLPVTELIDYSYCNMFEGCTSLTTTPKLPATTLATYCYNGMFSGCKSLTIAPELPATTLVQNCYYSMFSNCTNLKYIKCLATNISANNCLTWWTEKVSSTGTFIKATGVTWTSGYNGIPNNWTVEEVEIDE